MTNLIKTKFNTGDVVRYKDGGKFDEDGKCLPVATVAYTQRGTRGVNRVFMKETGLCSFEVNLELVRKAPKFKVGDKVRKLNGDVFYLSTRTRSSEVTVRWVSPSGRTVLVWGSGYHYSVDRLELVPEETPAAPALKHIVRFRDAEGNYLHQKEGRTHEKAVRIAEEYLKKNAGHQAELFELEGVFKAPAIDISYTPVAS